MTLGSMVRLHVALYQSHYATTEGRHRSTRYDVATEAPRTPNGYSPRSAYNKHPGPPRPSPSHRKPPHTRPSPTPSCHTPSHPPIPSHNIPSYLNSLHRTPLHPVPSLSIPSHPIPSRPITAHLNRHHRTSLPIRGRSIPYPTLSHSSPPRRTPLLAMTTSAGLTRAQTGWGIPTTLD